MVITLAIDDKRSIEKTNDINHIMQRMLLCEGNQLAKEHIGIIDMNQGSYIHDRRLIAPSCRGGRVEPMNLCRVAILKHPPRVIQIDNHSPESPSLSVADIDSTNGLLQAGHSLNHNLIDQLLITCKTYSSVTHAKRMDEFKQNGKDIPVY